MSKRFVLFDFDGTLVDSRPGLLRCVELAFLEHGIEVPMSQVRDDIGAPFLELFSSYGMSEAVAEACLATYRRHYRDGGMFEASVFDGVSEMLEALRSGGCVLATASSKPTVFVRALLEHFHLDQHFAHIVGAELDGSVSAKHEVVEQALAHLDADPREAVMVGDRRHDVEGARRCGVERTIGAAWGFGTIAELQDAGAWRIAEHPRAVPSSVVDGVI